MFGDGPFSGNPVAVVRGVGDLDSQAMLRITRWLNLSETTFLLPPTEPGADYHVRIFTLDRELPFAGHPTLGTCHAWLAGGGKPKKTDCIVQQCAAGPVRLRHIDGRMAFSAPPLVRSGPVEPMKLAEVLQVLRVSQSDIVDAQWIDNGPGWVGIMLDSADAVLDLKPLRTHSSRIEIGVIGPHPPGADAHYEIRAFFSDHHGGIIEDPVTGSLNASVAGWLYDSGRRNDSYIATQGTAIGRQGRVHVSRDSDHMIWIAGNTVTHFSGRVEL